MPGEKREFLNIIYSVVLLTGPEGYRRKHTLGEQFELGREDL
jgi:AMMECR1 domain-containing protein